MDLGNQEEWVAYNKAENLEMYRGESCEMFLPGKTCAVKQEPVNKDDRGPTLKKNIPKSYQ